MEKFTHVPVEKDTRIKKEKLIRINNVDALLQKWVWEGIVAESLIFAEEDVADLSDDELINPARQNDLIGENSQTTVARNSSGYAFINMNFETPL